MARRKIRQSKPSESAVIAAVTVITIAVLSAGFFLTVGYTGIYWSGCTGSITLTLTPTSVIPKQLVTANVGGLSGCNFYTYAGVVSGKICTTRGGALQNLVCNPIDVSSGSGNCSFKAPGSVNLYNYTACIDKNSNLLFTDTGESSGPVELNVATNICGNSIVEGPEVCDDTNLTGETCTSQGFMSGTLACNEGCSGYNTSGCIAAPQCGNDQIEGTEVCDGTDLAGETCISQGFTGGTLNCKADCSDYNTSSCTSAPAGPTAPICGNNVTETGEDCDIADMSGATCISQGFISGTLACNADCTFDTSGCIAAVCGNGKLETGEDCDGTKLDGQTCADMGFTGGKLACADDCTFDTSNCTSGAVVTKEDAEEAITKAQQDIITAQGGGKNITDATLKVNQAMAAANTGDYATAKTKAEAASLAAQTATAPQGFPVAMIGVAVVIIGVGAAIAYYLLKVNPDALKNFGKKEPAPAPAPAPPAE